LQAELLETRLAPATYTWTPTAAGAFNWNDPANWSGNPGAFPNAVDDVANITTALAGDETINLNQAITVGTLNLGASSGTHTFTVAGNGGSLTLQVSSGSAALNETGSNADVISAAVTLGSAATLGGSGALTLSGVISGGFGLTQAGSGATTLSAADTYSGATTISGGGLTLSGNGSLASTALTAGPGATLTLDNSGTNNTNRIPDAAMLSFNGATLVFVANNTASTASSETIGTLALVSGASTVQAGYAAAAAAGATSQLTLGNLSRAAGALVNFVGGAGNVTPLGTVTNQVVTNKINGAAPSAALVGSSTVAGHVGEGILPWAEVNGGRGTGDFAAYSPVSGGTGIIAFSGYASSIAAATATDTVKDTAAGGTIETVAGIKSINALLVVGSSAGLLALNAAATLTLGSGALMTTGAGGQVEIGNSFSAGNPQGALNFGAAEGVVWANSSFANTNVDAAIAGAGANGVTLGGRDALTWNTGSSAYTGGTTMAMAGGTLIPIGSGCLAATS
jgi:autotransporter-associated beta strand protein